MCMYWSNVQDSRHRWSRTRFTSEHNSNKRVDLKVSLLLPVPQLPSSQLGENVSLWIWICNSLIARFAHRQGLGEIGISFVAKHPRLTASCCHTGTLTRTVQKSRNRPGALNTSRYRADILSRSSVFPFPLNRYPASQSAPSLLFEMKQERKGLRRRRKALTTPDLRALLFSSTLIAEPGLQLVAPNTFFLGNPFCRIQIYGFFMSHQVWFDGRHRQRYSRSLFPPSPYIIGNGPRTRTATKTDAEFLP